MEDHAMTLTDDEVRERFSAFHDGELAPDEAKVVRERIESDATLRAEYEEFKRVMDALAVLASHASHGSPDGGAQPRMSVTPERLAPHGAGGTENRTDTSESDRALRAKSDDSSVLPEDEPVNLLPELQATLYKRSGGKFYKNRASRMVGTRPIEAMAVATLVLLLLMYVLMTYVSGLRPAQDPPSPESGTNTSAH